VPCNESAQDRTIGQRSRESESSHVTHKKIFDIFFCRLRTVPIELTLTEDYAMCFEYYEKNKQTNKQNRHQKINTCELSDAYFFILAMPKSLIDASVLERNQNKKK
jgi:hypothetical protein